MPGQAFVIIYEAIGKGDTNTATSDFVGISEQPTTAPYVPRIPFYLSTNVSHDVLTSAQDFLGIPHADQQGSYWFPRRPYFLPDQVEHDVFTGSEDFVHVPETERSLFWPRLCYYAGESLLPDHVEIVTDTEEPFLSEPLFFPRKLWLEPYAYLDLMVVEVPEDVFVDAPLLFPRRVYGDTFPYGLTVTQVVDRPTAIPATLYIIPRPTHKRRQNVLP